MSERMPGNEAVISLIHAGSREPGREQLSAPGGFAWYYLDLLTTEGDGLVLIWACGLPFLPGYPSASRRGEGELPENRPSLNLATYRSRRPDLFLLQEFPTEDGLTRLLSVMDARGADLVSAGAMLGVAATALMRAVLAIRYRQPPEGVLLHPLGAAIAVAIALNSYRWHRAGVVVWRGRAYPTTVEPPER